MPDANPYGNGRLPVNNTSLMPGLLAGALGGIRNGAGSTTIADGNIGSGIKTGIDDYLSRHQTTPTAPTNPMDAIYQQILDALGQGGGGGGGGGGGVSYAPNFSGIGELSSAYDQQIKALEDAMNAAKTRNVGEQNDLTGLYAALAKGEDNQRLAMGGQYDKSIADIGNTSSASADYVKNLIGSYMAQNAQYGNALGIDPTGVNGKLQETVANAVGNIKGQAANYQGLLGTNKATDNSLMQQYGLAGNAAGAAAKSNLAYALEKFLQQGSLNEAKTKGDKAMAVSQMRNQAIQAAGAATAAANRGGGGGGGGNNAISTLLALAKMKQGDISEADLNAYRQAQLGQKGNSQSNNMADFYAKLKGLKMSDQAINNAMNMFYGS